MWPLSLAEFALKQYVFVDPSLGVHCLYVNQSCCYISYFPSIRAM